MKRAFANCALAGMVALGAIVASAETVKLGKVFFIAETNVKMFRFKGEAQELRAQIQRNGTQLTSLEIKFPVESIKTGMDVRDKHMKERVFTAPDGSTPDVSFVASKSDCKPGDSPAEQKCTLDGKLSIRGQERSYPLTVLLKNGAQVSGHLEINVLDFGVSPQALTYSGVKVDPKAAVEFEVSLQ